MTTEEYLAKTEDVVNEINLDDLNPPDYLVPTMVGLWLTKGQSKMSLSDLKIAIKKACDIYYQNGVLYMNDVYDLLKIDFPCFDPRGWVALEEKGVI